MKCSPSQLDWPDEDNHIRPPSDRRLTSTN